MASNKAETRTRIEAVVKRWEQQCLLADGSLLEDGEQVWTVEALDRAYRNIVETPLLDGRKFLEKLREQLSDPELIALGAELLVIYYLFAWHGSIGADTKHARVNEVLGWGGRALDEDGEVWAALGGEGVGHPGQYFLLRPDIQLGFIMDFARRLKVEPDERRSEILADPWKCRDFADADADGGAQGMRHILLHLLYPESFEPISSGAHKQRIAATYGGLLTDPVEDVDEQLLAIHEALQELLNKPREELDFYLPPLAGTWGNGEPGEETDPIGALELKRQVVLFGPPGTSKTYRAVDIAGQIIRRQALREWGPVTYFESQGRVQELIDAHVQRLQLHPAYSYEEFIRGLRLGDGGVAYEDGYLLQLVARIESEEIPDGEAPLPWVLILDELNRADLSRVFGEAFSVLEDRDTEVTLAGVEHGQQPATIKLPRRLYVIGTMNLIDQSLEQIDFALRRRFLWWRAGFERQRLYAVLPELWQRSTVAKRYPWSRISGDMELFAERAELLNEHIADSALLGRDYEIGHTYFFDVVGLLAGAEYMHRKTRAGRFLWNSKKQARSPVLDLWRMSLEPLLDQYLQGVDAKARQGELLRLQRAFTSGGA